MKPFPKSDKLKSFFAPKMEDIITFLENDGKSAVYTGVNVNELYYYLDMFSLHW